MGMLINEDNKQHIDERMEWEYQSGNYMGSMLNVLKQRLGVEKVDRTFSWELKIGEGASCIPLPDAEDYLENQLGWLQRLSVERHLVWCMDGCKDAIDIAIRDEIEREREILPFYIEQVGLERAIREFEKSSEYLLMPFPLIRKYPEKIWAPVLRELQTQSYERRQQQ